MTTQKISCLLFRVPKKSSSTNLELDELHLNLWDFDNKKCTYLDLGLLIDVEELNSESLLISVPGKYDFEDVEDLGMVLSTNFKIVNAIFNEPIIPEGIKENFTVIKRSNDQIVLIPFNPNNNISYDTNTLCTELTINLEKIKEMCKGDKSLKIYIRFRIKNASRAKLIKSFAPEDKGILSSNTRTKILDVRVNESRWLTPDLNNSHNLVKFKKIHFFLTIDQEYELGDHSKNYNTSRSLREESIWKSYLSLGNDVSIENSLGYHWRTNKKSNEEIDSVESFSLLGRFSRIESSKFQILTFLAFLFFIGLISNSGASLIVTLLGSDNVEYNNIINDNLFSSSFFDRGDGFQENVIIVVISIVFVWLLIVGIKKTFNNICSFIKYKGILIKKTIEEWWDSL
ncbi:hypothetical protein [Neisseria subflava]|uniref:hypothetical protein n=1 Tax=Neisseria subflava TaxID=28449 RepID=UPI000D2F9A1F|nr:hypothetical protein [Neisseria subflava]